MTSWPRCGRDSLSFWLFMGPSISKSVANNYSSGVTARCFWILVHPSILKVAGCYGSEWSRFRFWMFIHPSILKGQRRESSDSDARQGFWMFRHPSTLKIGNVAVVLQSIVLSFWMFTHPSILKGAKRLYLPALRRWVSGCSHSHPHGRGG